MPGKSVNTVVLVSTENFVWHSMQEIIPSLEQLWLQSQQEGLHHVTSVNIDKMPMKEYLPLLFAADNIVISCFTFKMAQLTKFFRDELCLKARYVIHLHNQSTIACWPFHKFSLGGTLRQDDIFISSCSRDQATFRLGFENARVECVPFTFNKGMAPSDSRPVVENVDKNFVYIGRLSVQKNLHTLLWAYSHFLKGHSSYCGKLVFIGGEDDLGSPNMDMKSSGYLSYLKHLVQTFSLQDKVEFLGHMQREELYRHLEGQDYVFVTPSLHSDENFGMAAFRALVEGRNAVLTNWGGHTDYLNHFADQVELISVRGEEKGPWVSPYELAKGLEKSLAKKAHGYSLPSYYRSDDISRKYRNIALMDELTSVSLKKSELAEKVLKARETYSGSSATKIFASYEDSNVQPFFRGYGMTASPNENGLGDMIAAPWVTEDHGKWTIEDIHRGNFVFESGQMGKSVEVTLFDGTRRPIDSVLLEQLKKNGWVVAEL